MKKSRKMLLLMILVLIGVLVVACEKKETISDKTDNWDAIVKRGYFVVGLDDTFAPMGYRDDKGEIVGFDVELAKEFGKINNIEIKFQPIDWSLKETELNSGNIDAIWNGYSITPERLEKVATSKAYLENKQIIVTLYDSKINSKNDLIDKSIALQKESSAYTAVISDKNFMNNYNKEFIQFDTNNEAFMDLEAKRVDAVVVDEVLARYYMRLRGEEKYKVLKEDFGSEEFGVGIRKSDITLKTKLDNAIDELIENGTYKEIKLKYFSAN